MGPEKGVLEEKVESEVSPREEWIDCWYVGCRTGPVFSEEPVVSR
jgi:hypothetical protein